VKTGDPAVCANRPSQRKFDCASIYFSKKNGNQHSWELNTQPAASQGKLLTNAAHAFCDEFYILSIIFKHSTIKTHNMSSIFSCANVCSCANASHFLGSYF